jgi:putative flippase GtrA
MSSIYRLLQSKIVRFGIVGFINTTIDLLIFVTLRFVGAPVTFANICSTSVALVASLLLNHRYTFRGQALTRRTILLYVAVTLVGLWILQPIVINTLTTWNTHTHFIEGLNHYTQYNRLLITLLPKLASIVVTLVWNYVWYSQVVFRNNQEINPSNEYYRSKG